jgi:hypothetical protein
MQEIHFGSPLVSKETVMRAATTPVMCESLEGRTLYSITHTTFVIKVPGPTDEVVTIATNPAGNQAVGQNSVTTVSNHDANQLK